MRLVRPLDGPHGDMVPIRSKKQMLDGTEAVAQICVMRVCLNRGEWWENPDIGFRIPEFLAQNARQSDLHMLAQYIASYIANTYGVKGVTDVGITYDNHEMTFRAVVITGEGAEEVEVDLNGLL